MSLVFRYAGPGDVPDVARLGAHSFPRVAASLADWERLLLDSPLGGLETVWVGEDGGRIVAACRLLRYRQWICGRTLPVMGLSTVAISATDRRRGIAARLTTSGLRESRRRGDLATSLYPFRDSFYRKLGYGLAGEVQQFFLSPHALADHPGRSRVRLIDLPEDWVELQIVYDQWVPSQNGQFDRTERTWERVWEGGTRNAAVHRDESGRPTGYAVFRYLTEPVHGKRTVDVEEIVWLDREARLSLYAWLASLSDQWGQIAYRAHPEEGFAEHLSEHGHALEGLPRWHFWFPGAVLLYGPMFRLLDVERSWSARSIREGPALKLALEVHDEQIPENAGRWSLDLEGGRIAAARARSDESADVGVTASIEVVSRIYIGAISPTAAAAAGLLSVDRPEMLGTLDRLLATPRPWTFDRF